MSPPPGPRCFKSALLQVRAASSPRCFHVRAAFTSALPPRSSPSSPLAAGRRNGRGGSGAFCLLDLRDQAGGLSVGQAGPALAAASRADAGVHS
jgi:hypothetical protein